MLAGSDLHRGVNPDADARSRREPARSPRGRRRRSRAPCRNCARCVSGGTNAGAGHGACRRPSRGARGLLSAPRIERGYLGRGSRALRAGLGELARLLPQERRDRIRIRPRARHASSDHRDPAELLARITPQELIVGADRPRAPVLLDRLGSRASLRAQELDLREPRRLRPELRVRSKAGYARQAGWRIAFSTLRRDALTKSRAVLLEQSSIVAICQ
jgi:hypothetical protein